jgi:transposase-like protein
MSTKHTNPQVAAVIDAIVEVAGDETLSLVLNHLELSRHAAQHLMEREVAELAGERYSHQKPHGGRYSRWGSNPGSIGVGGQRLPVSVPRMRDNENEHTLTPTVYGRLREMDEPPMYVVEAIFRGLGTRQYGEVAEVLMDSFGLSKSRLSELFVKQSGQIMEAFLERRLDDARYVAMYVDGKNIQGQSMVVAIGVTDKGNKRTLGLTQATTENSGAIATMFRDMLNRGFDVDDGLLVVIDGGKGLRKAVEDVFGVYAVVQRCVIHKMRNILEHLPESERPAWKRKLAELYFSEDLTHAQALADELYAQLAKINVSAARSLAEGLEESLTLCRLGLQKHFGRTFATTNAIESANSAIARFTRHVTRWTTGDQRMRWCTLALIEVESSWRKVQNFSRLPILRNAIVEEVKRRIDNQQSPPKASRFSTKKRA